MARNADLEHEIERLAQKIPGLSDATAKARMKDVIKAHFDDLADCIFHHASNCCLPPKTIPGACPMFDRADVMAMVTLLHEYSDKYRNQPLDRVRTSLLISLFYLFDFDVPFEEKVQKTRDKRERINDRKNGIPDSERPAHCPES